MRTCALIPAAGRGARFGAPQNKIFEPLLGRPVLGWTLQAFADCDAIDDILLIGAEDDIDRLRDIGAEYGGGKVRDVVLGGADRQASVRNGLAAWPDAKYIVVHDAARPCVTTAIIEQVLSSAHDISGAATAVVPIADTLVRGPFGHRWYDRPEGGSVAHAVGENVPRDNLYAVQTPQAFDAKLLRAAHEKAALEGFQGTDDCSLISWFHGGGEHGWYYLRTSSPENLKITRPEDMALAEAILMRRDFTPLSQRGTSARERAGYPRSGWRGVRSPGPRLRIGHGYDVHPFADPSENRTLYLGGVAFPESPQGMKAHSDGDVLLHALCDALLGAAGMGDIGKLFPPSDMRHKDRPSIEFLREVAVRLRDAGWSVGNVDITVIAEKPKIGPKSDTIKHTIAVELDIEPGQIGLKATTNEGLGFIGRGEGIAAHVTALLLHSE